LVKIKIAYPEETLYSSLCAYTEAEGDAKSLDFLKTLSLYRSIAEGMNVHTLIAKIYRESGLLTLAGESGGKENLMLLYDYARRFEGGAFRGLYSFINYINSVINKKVRFDATKDEENTDSVKIVTVHGSKGLEYPVVFYVDTGHKFSNKEARERITYAEDFGIAMYLRSDDGLALVKNPVREVILDYNKTKSFEEELRILYVALTRARERLIITGERSKKREDFDRELKILREHLNPYTKNHLKSHLSVMLMSDIETSTPSEALGEESELQGAQGELPCEQVSAPDAISVAELLERFNYTYPNEHLTSIPEKLSVSRLYPEVLDGRDDSAQLLSGDLLSKTAVTPQFIGAEDKAERSRRAGIATHTFMQFTDFERLNSQGAAAELERLTSEGYISSEDAKAVRLAEIEAFRKSQLFSRILDAKTVHRELRFNIKLPADKFTQNPERQNAISDKTILVQGVIDCVIVDKSGEIYLIDYKTDRLTEYERKHKAAAAEKLNRSHAEQLSYYEA
ncbi:MAG: PD-(D/E)XK nuclease family protein, partial [Clostridia bacterium]|nr:PD-(D/E)XK nuclease family protein [Clostridia bacterium]